MNLALSCIVLVLTILVFSGVVALFMDEMSKRRRNQGLHGWRSWMRVLKRP